MVERVELLEKLGRRKVGVGNGEKWRVPGLSSVRKPIRRWENRRSCVGPEWAKAQRRGRHQSRDTWERELIVVLSRCFEVTRADGRADVAVWLGTASTTKRLVGCWHLVRASDPEIERAEADFREDGRLFYSVLSRDRWQVMKLTYRIEGNTIVTDQPSAARQERSHFDLAGDGTLMLELDGVRSWFRRGDKVAPQVE